MFRCRLKPALLSALLTLPSLLGAVELGEHFRLNGFATIGASTVLEEGQEFRAYTSQRDGVRKGEVNFTNNTLFGLQATVQATEAFSATVQGVVYNSYDANYDAKVDWAYLSYVTDFDLTLRAGKFRLPLFNSSELTYVGYARSWVRPALPFYGVAGFEHYTGGDLKYHFGTGATQYALLFGYGIGDEASKTPNGGTRHFDSDDILIAKATADGNFFHAGITYFQAHTHMRVTSKDGKVINDITTPAQMVSTEGMLFLGDTTIEAGIGYGWTKEKLPNELLVYAGASYQIEAWRPYLLYASKTFDHKQAEYRRPSPNAPPPPPQLGYVSENIFSLGLRYDFMEQADVKFQVDRVLGMQYVPQLLISDDSADREATVFTLTVDMVF